MKLSSIREIKSHFLSPLSTFNVGVARPEVKFPRSIALGVGGDGRLAVRCYGGKNQSKMQRAFVEVIEKLAFGEVDTQFVVMPTAFDATSFARPETQNRQRPLRIGYSTGHFRCTAGSSGAMATNKKGQHLLLSNNHVLSMSNEAAINDDVLQPGPADGGHRQEDVVAKVANFIKINKEHNLVDAAVALINDGIEIDPSTLGEFGKFEGLGDGDLDIGMPLHKLGRTTHATRGVITGLEMDGVRVNYGGGKIYSFDSQVEIRSTENDERSPGFSAGGDSGSSIHNSKNKAVALLFAGGGGITYANDMQNVVNALKITLLK